MPYDIVNEKAVPVYEDVKGWSQPLTGITAEAEMPTELNAYIKYIEAKTAKPISIVSVRPDRKQTIIRKELF